MKRILLSLCVILSLIIGCVRTAFAADGRVLYDDKETDYVYSVVYDHYGQDGTTDWALVSASVETEPGICHAVFGNIVLLNAPTCYPYHFSLAVYDVKEEQFFDIAEAWDMGFDDLRQAFLR